MPSFLSRSWDFVKRHKWKLVAAFSVSGCVIYYGRKLYIRAKEIKDLWKSAMTSDLLSDDFLQHFSSSCSSSDEDKMRLLFIRNQKISDLTVQRHLSNVRSQLNSLMNIERFTSKLRNNSNALTTTEKEMYFACLKVLVFGRFVTTIYLLNLLLLLHRVEVNIIGRQLFTDISARGVSSSCSDGEEEEEKGKSSSRETLSEKTREEGKEEEKKINKEDQHEENFVFLSSTRYVSSNESIIRIGKVILQEVEEVVGCIPPHETITVNDLYEIISTIFMRVENSLFLSNNFDDSFPPPPSSSSSPSPLSPPSNNQTSSSGRRNQEGENSSSSSSSNSKSGGGNAINAENSREICQSDEDVIRDSSSNISNVVRVVLPENVSVDDTHLSSEGRLRVQRFLSETRDFLESPQFLVVFRFALNASAHLALTMVSEKVVKNKSSSRRRGNGDYNNTNNSNTNSNNESCSTFSGTTTTSSAAINTSITSVRCETPQMSRSTEADCLRSGGDVETEEERKGWKWRGGGGGDGGGRSVEEKDDEFIFARCFGRICNVSDLILSNEGSAGFVEEFAEIPSVSEFCEIVYYPQSFERNEAAPPNEQLEEFLRQLAMDDNL